MPADLFDYFSTYSADYKYVPTRRIRPSKKPKPQSPIIDKFANRRPEPKYMDLESFTEFKNGQDLPFDLFKRHKPCVNANPLQSIPNVKEYKRVDPDERREARNKRPRIYMVPAICLDNISEDVMYKEGGLVDNLYTSDWKEAQKITNPKVREWPQQTTVYDKGLESVRFKSKRIKDQNNVPVKELIKWENVNVRRNIPKAVEEPEMPAEPITGELSLSYQIPKTGYTGYIPKLAVGVSREKKTFTLASPYVTNTMVAQGNYKKIQK